MTGERAAIVNQMADLAIKSILPDSETCDESAFADCLVKSDQSINFLNGSPRNIFNTPCASDYGCKVLVDTNSE